jgi:hypothetical protein
VRQISPVRIGERSAFPKINQFGFGETVMAAKRKPAKLRPDVAETAFRVYQDAIGEAPKTLPPAERVESRRRLLWRQGLPITFGLWKKFSA